jgi:hypothetical protein
MKIIENFLPIEIHQKYLELLISNTFPYYYIDGVSHTDGTEDDFFFFHNLHGNPHNFTSDGGEIVSRYFNRLIMPILGRLPFTFNNLLRARINLFTRKQEPIMSNFHRDLEDKHTVALYYLNSNNGETVFKTGEKVPSVANQMLIFDGHMDHAVIPQTDEKVRVNINLNLS